ncbi:MAG: ATP-dependent zinc metalloprotease FtsH [Tissierellia bacterium]|nr:ATP-dependent zinc metalloprotease FtsH [Tissierellia bacterium]
MFNDGNNKRKKPMIYYYIGVIIVMFLINFFIWPRMAGEQVELKEVTYDVFLDSLDEKNIKEAFVGDTEINYTLIGEEENLYKVVKFDPIEDTDLIPNLKASGAAFGKVRKQQMNPILAMILNMALMVAFFVIIGQVLNRTLMKKMGGSGGGVGPMSFGKSNAKIYVKPTEGITFKDVAGQDEAKEALNEIVDFLHNPQKYSSIGAKLPKGALLVGPPGTGKTLLAQAVAGEADVPFFSISGSEFVEMFVGLGAAKVRDLFQQANEKAPCIVFIDEIDTIGKKRDGAGFGGNDEREQTLNQLLSEMDGFDGNKGVVILGATNRPNTLDPALLRPGRFDRRIPVELPDLNGRVAILQVHIQKVRHAPDIDLNFIGRSTAGTSGADLANMVNEAALRAVRDGRDRVETHDLLESVEIVIAGYQKKNAVISPREKEIIAYHEVGHALVAASQTGTAPVEKITIVPRTSGALGYIMQVDEEEKYLYTKEDLFNQIVVSTGGRAAEEVVFSIQTSGASNDIEKATGMAKAMITRFGMNDKIGMVAMEVNDNPYLEQTGRIVSSDATEYVIEQEVRNIIESAHNKAVDILKENMDKLHSIARYLLEKETITGEEFMEIFNQSN